MDFTKWKRIIAEKIHLQEYRSGEYLVCLPYYDMTCPVEEKDIPVIVAVYSMGVPIAPEIYEYTFVGVRVET